MTGTNALLDSGMTSLPVNVPAVAEHFGIKMVDYEAFTKIYKVEKQELYSAISYAGFSMEEEGHYLCVVNSSLCGPTRRHWTAAHEVGHVLCGHIVSDTSPTPAQEREADQFAAELLAPLTVLHFCGASSALEIERLCGLSRQAATVRFRELSRLRRSDEERFNHALRLGELPPESLFLQTEENMELFRKFAPFISGYVTRRAAHDGYEQYLEMKARNSMAI